MIFVDAEGRLEQGADHALLPPHFAGPQLAVGVQAGELGTGTRTAGREIVSAAGTKNEVAAVPGGRGRRAEHLDVVDLRAVRTANSFRAQRPTHFPRELGECAGILGNDRQPGRVDQEEPVPSPGDITGEAAVTRDVERYLLRRAIAGHVVHRYLRAVVQLDRDHAYRGLDAMRARPHPTEVGKGDCESDR